MDPRLEASLKQQEVPVYTYQSCVRYLGGHGPRRGAVEAGEAKVRNLKHALAQKKGAQKRTWYNLYERE